MTADICLAPAPASPVVLGALTNTIGSPPCRSLPKRLHAPKLARTTARVAATMRGVSCRRREGPPVGSRPSGVLRSSCAKTGLANQPTKPSTMAVPLAAAVRTIGPLAPASLGCRLPAPTVVEKKGAGKPAPQMEVDPNTYLNATQHITSVRPKQAQGGWGLRNPDPLRAGTRGRTLSRNLGRHAHG